VSAGGGDRLLREQTERERRSREGDERREQGNARELEAYIYIKLLGGVIPLFARHFTP